MTESAGPGPSERHPPSATHAAERVASIVAAAEEAADRLRTETEERVRDRIAEAQRAADNRVQAAEEEAAEIVRMAQAEATRLRDEGRGEVEAAKSGATGEALGVVARAEETHRGSSTRPRSQPVRGRAAGSFAAGGADRAARAGRRRCLCVGRDASPTGGEEAGTVDQGALPTADDGLEVPEFIPPG